jgi:cysteine desulfurase
MDHHATTPTDSRVLERMLPFFNEDFGNASSRHHSFGWKARDAVAQARRQVADLIGADPREIYFTSGATESNNLAIKGFVRGKEERPLHLVTMSTEHEAVLDPYRALEREGIEVTYLEPRSDGLIDLDAFQEALRENTRFVSVMMANNEIGVLQPLYELGQITASRGIVLHSDAAQAVGKVPIDIKSLGVDLMSITAHKMYGPKGIGALYVRRGRPRPKLEALFDGGGHENGLRPGTVNVPGAVGFGAAAEICREEMTSESRRVSLLRDRLLGGLTENLSGVTVNGSMRYRLPHSLNVSFDCLEGESLLLALGDIAVSSGAACASANPKPSHVLHAIGVSEERARASIRFGLGRSTSEAQVDYVIGKVVSIVNRLRELSPYASR